MENKIEFLFEMQKIFGILSIVFAFFMPLVGLIFGIFGLTQIKKGNARKLNILGIIISILGLILTMFLVYYAFSISGVASK